MTIDIKIDGVNSNIYAVPAVHFNMVFAHAVRKVFLKENSRPTAVAVELGPSAVANLLKWLRELSQENKDLPRMLGLIRTNRFIHPKYRRASLNLQQRFGKPLHEISPKILRHEINYSMVSLLCLSATDSIIEAIRCALEYKVDIYGIDLESFASCERPVIQIEDPIAAIKDLKSYIERNAKHSALSRDNIIDGRRERVMASKLKWLAKKHDKILFTGGLAHWDQICHLLCDPDLPYTNTLPPSDDKSYTRVIVDPAIAINHMDMLPEYTPYYENVRTSLNDNDLGSYLDISEKIHRKIAKVYQSISDTINDEHLHLFLRYLNNLSLLNQRIVPDLNCVLTAADITVSEIFAKKMVRKLTETSKINWLKPNAMLGLPYLRAVPLTTDESFLLKNCHKAELIFSDKRFGPFFFSERCNIQNENVINIDPFFDDHIPNLNNNYENQSNSNNNYSNSKSSSNPWIWPPCEALFYGTAYSIAEHALTKSKNAASEPFTGEMHEGIDMKATLRAAISNKFNFHVKVSARGKPQSIREALQEPFVYIFQKPEKNRSMEGFNWQILIAGNRTEKDFNSEEVRQRFKDIKSEKGDRFVASVLFVEKLHKLPDEAAKCKAIDRINFLWGGVAFGNPCLNDVQCIRWLDENNFKCCPVLLNDDLDQLIKMYEKTHNILLDVNNWPETLIRIAIPYARRRVLLMSPDHSAVTQRVRMEARRHRISIDIVPLSFISSDRLIEIRNQYSIYPIDEEATQWPTEIIDLLGPSNNHFKLLPSWIRKQANI